jgi:hypothetical protein
LVLAHSAQYIVAVMKREKFPKNAPEKSGTNYLREIKTLKSLQHASIHVV